MPRKEVEIINKLGLHARASAKLVQALQDFDVQAHLVYRNREVNGKSIMGVMMLAAARGTTVIIDTEGADADAAMQALEELIADRFGEEE